MTVNNAVYIETNIFPIAALLVILNNLRHDMSFSWRRHCVEVIMKLSIFIMFFNTVGCAIGYILFVICNGIRRKHYGQ